MRVDGLSEGLTLIHSQSPNVKLSTNYAIHADVTHVGYYSGDGSLTVYTTSDEQIEIFGVDISDMIRCSRNFLVVDIKNTDKARLCEHQIKSLTEIRDALTEYLKEEKE